MESERATVPGGVPVLTDSNSSAVGVDLIVKSFLLQQLGENPKSVRAVLADDIIVVNVADVLAPAEMAMVQNQADADTFQRLREKVLRQAEHILCERIESFLHRPVRRIQYVFGSQPEHMDIIIFLH